MDINLGKLIKPEVFVDVDLVKALIKAYKLVNHAFHKKDKSELCTMEKGTFIEDFGLGGPLSVPIDSDNFDESF